MRVKKFIARTLPDAMAQVRGELGPEAVILHTNEIKVGGVFGLFSQRMIQVMAAVEMQPVPATRSALQPSRPVPEPALAAAVTPEAAAPTAPGVASAVATAPSAALELAVVQEDVAELKDLMGQMLDRISLPASADRLEPELQPLFAALLRGGVQEETALGLLGRVRSRVAKANGPLTDAEGVLRDLMIRDLDRVRTVDDGGRVVALVGPTGVGKTTTMAKLAAHFVLQRRMRIAMITADTYRIAAVDQLRTYSEILGVPLEVVYEPSEVRAAVDRHSDRDLILVDTAGRSPKNEEHMAELKAYLEALAPADSYLVLSMASGYREATMVVDNYLPAGFDHFLFTKWDESASPGLIYNIVSKYKRPLSYITTGQNVPEDIEVANPLTIIRAILGDCV